MKVNQLIEIKDLVLMNIMILSNHYYHQTKEILQQVYQYDNHYVTEDWHYH
mgnify:CR=1 FL=1